MNANEIEGLYKKYFNMVYRISFLYMKNEQDASDVVQETFIRLIKCNGKFENEKQIKAWLIVTASNYCKSLFRQWWRKNRSEFDEEGYAKIISSDSNFILEEVLNLPEKYKLSVYLYYFEGYSTGEIGKMLGSNASTIQSRLAKARKILKLEIEGY